MAAPLWKNACDRANAQKLIDWLLSQTGAGGLTGGHRNTIALSELVSSSSHPRFDHSAAVRVLGSMRTVKQSSVDEFEALFQKDRGEQEKRQALNRRKWKFFLPMELTLGPDLRRAARVRILGHDFYFRPAKSVFGELQKDDRRILRDRKKLSLEAGVKVESSPSVFISTYCESHDSGSAWDEVVPAFDALRGLIELDQDYQRLRISRGDKNRRRHVPHPLWMMAQEPGERVEWHHFITEENGAHDLLSGAKGRALEVSDDWLTEFRQAASFLRRKGHPSSTTSLVVECLRLYSLAMDAPLRDDCLFRFWQLAEAITCAAREGGSTRTVVNGLAWHGNNLALAGSGYESTLRKCAEIRNDIAHRSIGGADDEYINVLKLACEVALVWIIQQRDALPTKSHLTKFYDLRRLPTGQLATAKEIIDYIENTS